MQLILLTIRRTKGQQGRKDKDQKDQNDLKDKRTIRYVLLSYRSFWSLSFRPCCPFVIVGLESGQ